MESRIVYMDNNATTRMADEVKQILKETEDLYGNGSSMHSLGRNAREAIEWARGEVAVLLGAKPDEIFFNSGATEGNNTVFNTFRDLIDEGGKRNRILLSSVEHPASIESAKYMVGKGYKVETVPVDSSGRLDLDALEKMMGDDVALLSVMVGNNESGAIEPVKEASAIARRYGSYVHADATQAIGKIPVDVNDLDVDYLTLSAHKFYGPKGVGAIYIRTGVPRMPFLHGGHQEEGLRAGTYNTQAIAGLGKAAELARKSVDDERKYLWGLRMMLKEGIAESIPDVVFNGSDEYEKELPGTLNVSFPGAEGESILLYLDLEGIEVSTGSACASGSLEPSYVLLASGLDVELAHGSIRFSLGRYNDEDDVKYVLEKLPPIISRIRAMSTRRI